MKTVDSGPWDLHRTRVLTVAGAGSRPASPELENPVVGQVATTGDRMQTPASSACPEGGVQVPARRLERFADSQ